MGGGACVIIIDGEGGQASIARYIGMADSSAHALNRQAKTARLLSQVRASCTLTYYLDLKLDFHHKYLPDTLLDPIIAFHQGLTVESLQGQTMEQMDARAAVLRALNEQLAQGAYAILEGG